MYVHKAVLNGLCNIIDMHSFRDSVGWLFVLLYLSSIPSMISRFVMKKATAPVVEMLAIDDM